MKNIAVCAAVIVRGGMALVATRPPGREMSGQWEFPGGKLHPGETPSECLRRELKEELDLEVTVFDTMFMVEHEYPGKKVCIRFMRCGMPSDAKPLSREGQQWRWSELCQLPGLELLPADRPFADFLVRGHCVADEK